MSAHPARLDVSTLLVQIEHTPGIDRLRSLDGAIGSADAELTAAILEQAADFCAGQIAPINPDADRQGCRLNDGRVTVPTAFAPAWDAYVKLGWPMLDLPEEIGGQGLPLFLSSTVQQLLDGSCAAFGMLPVLVRSAARLIHAHGSEAMRAEWLPRLVSGEWAATICISEADAGSDASRARAAAVANDDGSWSVTGEKMWISFGDHDLCPRIGHCVLARTESGLSLFLVPDTLGDGTRNSVSVRRIEHKLGLHGSPTCALGLERAKGWLIGQEGRGLSQLFVMIVNMRLCVGAQGLGLGATAVQVAREYSSERRQGGPPGLRPITIDEHPDVQRQLLEMISKLEVLRGLGLLLGVQADLARHDPDQRQREDAAALVAFLLPIYKTLAGGAGFELSSDAIQVLGGAGYTDEWPVEQALRDGRVATIYEGTTGMQALDLLHRRLWHDGAAGLAALLTMVRNDLAGRSDDPAMAALEGCAILERAADRLEGLRDDPPKAEAGATAFLELAGLATLGWIAARLCVIAGEGDAARELRVAGVWFSRDLVVRCTGLEHRIAADAACRELFESLSGHLEPASAVRPGVSANA